MRFLPIWFRVSLIRNTRVRLPLRAWERSWLVWIWLRRLFWILWRRLSDRAGKTRWLIRSWLRRLLWCLRKRRRIADWALWDADLGLIGLTWGFPGFVGWKPSRIAYRSFHNAWIWLTGLVWGLFGLFDWLSINWICYEWL